MCYPCQKFSHNASFQFSNWKKPERLKKHSQSKDHNLSMEKWLNYQINKSRNASILTQINEGYRATVTENRNYLKVIIETLVFTAMQNIAQRGMVEDRSGLSEASNSNRGNFLELLHLRCKDIPWLAAKLAKQKEKHAQWLSPDIQNELLDIYSNQILHIITTTIKESSYFALIVDETTDISNKEQVAVCLRYVTKGATTESFLGYIEVESTTGENLFNLVLNKLQKFGLDISKLVGQCYDGAANMSGCKKGLGSRVREVSPLAIYVHCYAHLLNLALQDTLEEVPILRNAIGIIQSLYNFFHTPKREAILKNLDDNNLEAFCKLKSMSLTRWACRWEAVKSVERQFTRITAGLVKLSNCKDSQTYVDAQHLLHAVTKFSFLFGLQVLKVIFSNTHALAVYLQNEQMDVGSAKTAAEATVKTLQLCRSDENFFLLWEKSFTIDKTLYSAITNLAEILQALQASSRPRRQHVPSRRLQALVGEEPNETAPASNEEDVARIQVYYNGLDRVMAEIRETFSSKIQIFFLLCLM